ncbi:GntR family transcriptional regulator [Jeotgalicoccus coquinae]|uniref:DNA-binding transcriptional regulator YhcF (GntR family) n=1 Tax=Jeotgalicoccus coquinae TaxID=709509 RepID=A0A6V7RPT0_9STAP|nr:GntR family transcriptional regulator [Jeotgalicoccus coquinae]MBB6423892.1 DNA-binding transcriptional regulator YhcF (GntR family) [Jeotgalicoccus coquinae]GGE24183.1 GntR family transcriptional regulator [Jeotgalicoccus coquinae]CAD2080572.1 putative HTH-type transcriptional regulator YurK [Jeotgalicoccus coquinae]
MSNLLNEKKPIYEQIRDWLADQIIDETLVEHDKVPSTNEIVTYFKVNHITVSKGVTELVEEGVLYKKRGVGMFVEEGARNTLLAARREGFVEEYLKPMLEEARKLDLTESDIQKMINVNGSDK